MKAKTLFLVATLMAMAQGAWAQTTNVGNETELRGAIENGANITLTQDISIGSAASSMFRSALPLGSSKNVQSSMLKKGIYI